LPKTHEDLEWLDPWLELDSMADLADLPREWLICPSCSEFGWRFPPHSFKPCPLVVGMAESAGLKFDAERMAAVRAGVHLEDMGKAMREYLDEHGLGRGDAEEEEDE
jgi:hypothetical protein